MPRHPALRRRTTRPATAATLPVTTGTQAASGDASDPALPRGVVVLLGLALAMGVLHTLWIRQLAPGRDIAVVGFDDSQVAQVYPVGLTSVRQPLEDVAVEIVRTLRALLSHQPVETRGVLLEPTLAIRGSS